jgi:hypothetical protein
MRRLNRLLVALLATTLPILGAECPCVYQINRTINGHPLIFTSSLLTDFTLPNASLTYTSAPNHDWVAQAYNVTLAASRGPFGKIADPANAILTNQGLELWVRSELVSLENDGGRQAVPIAEVVTARSDFLYGSFRVGMRTTGISGTCAAFFFYHNDSSEIDIEILSRQQSRSDDGDGGGGGVAGVANLVLQSPRSLASGYNAVNTAFHEYRFDWLPSLPPRVDMYADGVFLRSFNDSVPDSPGALHLIHWSNGDAGWSGGPPKQDAVVVVEYVRAYFNTSEGGWDSKCQTGGGGRGGGEEVKPSVAMVSDGPAPQPMATGTTSTVTAEPSATGTGNGSGAKHNAAALAVTHNALLAAAWATTVVMALKWIL